MGCGISLGKKTVHPDDQGRVLVAMEIELKIEFIDIEIEIEI